MTLQRGVESSIEVQYVYIGKFCTIWRDRCIRDHYKARERGVFVLSEFEMLGVGFLVAIRRAIVVP